MSVGVKYKPGHRIPKMLLLPSPHATPTEGLVPRAPAPEREATAVRRQCTATGEGPRSTKDPAQPKKRISVS